MNENQFGFRPQKFTIDAAMVVKEFEQDSLAAGDIIALVTYKALLMQPGGPRF